MLNSMKKATLILSAGLSLALAKDLFAQNSVSGYITNLFTEEPVPGAVVEVQDLGTEVTDSTGYYAVGDTANVVKGPEFYLPEDEPNKIEIYNMNGQEVKTLEHKINTWDITNNSGIKVASGMYPFMVFNKDNQPISSGLIPVIDKNLPVSLVPLNTFNQIENYNYKNGGRRINDPLDDYVEVRINHPDFWERINYIPEPVGNGNYNEVLISGDSTFLDFVDEACNRTDYYGSVRWEEDPLIYIRPSFQNGQPVPQSEVDKCIDAILDLPTLTNGFITGQYIIVDSLPPAQTDGVINVCWDSGIPFYAAHGVNYGLYDHVIYYGVVLFKFSNTSINAVKHEFSQVVGPISDSDILLSVFNGSGLIYYTEEDLKLGKALYSREPNWKSPDTNDIP